MDQQSFLFQVLFPRAGCENKYIESTTDFDEDNDHDRRPNGACQPRRKDAVGRGDAISEPVFKTKSLQHSAALKTQSWCEARKSSFPLMLSSLRQGRKASMPPSSSVRTLTSSLSSLQEPAEKHARVADNPQGLPEHRSEPNVSAGDANGTCKQAEHKRAPLERRKKPIAEEFPPEHRPGPMRPPENGCSKLLADVRFRSLEDCIRAKLRELGIETLIYEETEAGDISALRFVVSAGQVEKTMFELQCIGLGRLKGTSLSVLPMTMHIAPINPKIQETKAKLDKFYLSIKSRMIVAEVIATIRAGTQFTFDFLLLLILASIIAFMGLIENSSVTLVASMLVSPLMGPILAIVFGAVIQDTRLMMKGVTHEAQAIFLCILMGFLLGLFACPTIQHISLPQWPTLEMLARGTPRSLVVGVLVAIPSGAGVALSVLGGNAGSLVGVAISASLLPPAVNAGLFWALGVVLAVGGESSPSAFFGYPLDWYQEEYDETGATTVVKNLEEKSEVREVYLPQYSTNQAVEAFVLGLVSLALTLINIICIIFTGFIILRLKEVTPEKIPQRFSSFWKKDVKAHRHYYRTKGTKAEQGEFSDTSGEGLDGTFMQSLFDRAAVDEDLLNIREWVYIPKLSTPGPSARFDQAVRSRPARRPMLLRGVSVAQDPSFLSIPSFIQREVTRSRSFGDFDKKKRTQV